MTGRIAFQLKKKDDKNDNWLNLFGGFKFWEWGEIEDWEEDFTTKLNNYQLKDNSLAYMVEEWWKKYMEVISGGVPKIASYLKCLMGRSLFHPTILSKVMVCFSGKEGAGSLSQKIYWTLLSVEGQFIVKLIPQVETRFLVLFFVICNTSVFGRK